MEKEPPPIQRYVIVTAQREDVYELFTAGIPRPDVHLREMYGKNFRNNTIIAVVGGGIAEREPGWPESPARHPR
jgi:hypothetical protein